MIFTNKELKITILINAYFPLNKFYAISLSVKIQSLIK